jgi:hypothetical protein
MNWKPEVKVQGSWERNGLVFATQEEAALSARTLFFNWGLCENHRAVEVDADEHPVNYKYGEDGILKAVKKQEV